MNCAMRAKSKLSWKGEESESQHTSGESGKNESKHATYVRRCPALGGSTTQPLRQVSGMFNAATPHRNGTTQTKGNPTRHVPEKSGFTERDIARHDDRTERICIFWARCVSAQRVSLARRCAQSRNHPHSRLTGLRHWLKKRFRSHWNQCRGVPGHIAKRNTAKSSEFPAGELELVLVDRRRHPARPK